MPVSFSLALLGATHMLIEEYHLRFTSATLQYKSSCEARMLRSIAAIVDEYSNVDEDIINQPTNTPHTRPTYET